MERKSDFINVIYPLPSISRRYTGVFDVSRNLAVALQEYGVNVCVHGLHDEYTDLDLPLWDSLKPKVHAVIGPAKLGYSPTLYKGLIGSGASLAHVHALWSYSALAAATWCRKAKKPLLLSSNGYLDKWALSQSRWRKKAALRLGFDKVLKGASAIQVNSIEEAKCVRDLGLDAPIVMISNGVHLPKIASNASSTLSAVNRDNGQQKTLLFLGRIHEKKGVHLLVEAWAKLANNAALKDWRLSLVGFSRAESSYELFIKNQVRNLGISSKVQCSEGIYGAESDRVIASCDAFILPSYSEGASIAVLRAWSHGKPAVITPECGFPDAIENGICLSISTSVDSIENGCLRLINLSDEDLIELGTRSRHWVEKKHSWAAVSKEVAKVYRWLIYKDNTPPESILTI